MTLAATDPRLGPTLTLLRRRRIVTLGALAILAAYLAYAAVAFDVAGVAGRARMDNALLLLQDFWSYKTHVTRDNRTAQITTAIEGSRKMTYAAGQEPGWVHRTGEGVAVDLPGGAVAIDEAGTVTVTPADGAPFAITPARSGITTSGTLPDWVSASDSRVQVTLPGGGGIAVTKTRTEVLRRSAGWECFFFALDSRWSGVGPARLISAAMTEPGAARSIWRDFWTNPVWHHADVAWAMAETVLMAFVGTMGAALISLPLAFLSARNFSPSLLARFGSRRGYDFLRGVDALIWTVILSRAFGPGPLTGALAILLTDVGTFGKLFSEALENIDGRQIEGLRATGAGPIARARWGVIPQIAPVILSQVLYMLESNTRGATVIGAIVGGGIGLMLTQAIVTQKDWEQVAWYIVLIVLTVMVMDSVSGWLRRRLIEG